MDLLYVFIVLFLILQVDGGDVMSSLLGSPEDITCTNHFIWLNTIGYIQCQRQCIRYSICDVLQFKTDLLECRLYVGSSCNTAQDPNIYLRRTDIKEQVYRGCGQGECPSSSCIRLRDGQPSCVHDRVIAQHNSVGASFAEVDGVFFGLHGNEVFPEGEARNSCVSHGGRLAIVNTQRKISMLSTAMQGIDMHNGLIGLYKSSGLIKWATGEPMQSRSYTSNVNELCFVMDTSGQIIDVLCDAEWNFICELMSGI